MNADEIRKLPVSGFESVATPWRMTSMDEMTNVLLRELAAQIAELNTKAAPEFEVFWQELPYNSERYPGKPGWRSEWVQVHAGYVLADGKLHYEMDDNGQTFGNIGIARAEYWRLKR